MSSTVADQILDQALQQPERERARLAESLLASLDETPDQDVEVAWQVEIGRRLREMDSGAVECIPWEEVRDRLYTNAHA